MCKYAKYAFLTRLCMGMMVLWFCACQPSPQQVRHLSDDREVDTSLIAQLQWNMHMSALADKQCADYVKQDTIQYVMDDFGFWYSHTLKNQADSLQHGQAVTLHMQLYLLTDSLIADMCEEITIGTGELPMAVYRGLTFMRHGEQMHIVAPWNTAYGVEGTSLIPPYTNVKFIISTIE